MKTIPHITIIVDNPNSWFRPYAKRLVKELQKLKFKTALVKSSRQIKKGGLAFFLSCEEIVSQKTLDKSIHNLVVHASKLPKGRGMSPLSWQIEEGKNVIPVTLFEVSKKVDSGDIYFQTSVRFTGHELVDELRDRLGEVIVDLILGFVKKYPNIKGKKQRGNPTYYRRRFASDSELDVNKTIREQFNKLRVVDNERYPASFEYRGKKYIVKIYKSN